MSNDSGIRPIEERILLKVRETETMTPGGIIIPDTTKERRDMAEMQAEVIEIGPSAFRDYENDGDYAGMPVPFDVGDTVLIGKYAGLLYTGADEKEYRVVGLKDIVGVKV